MSKMDNLRAMREARYAEAQKRAGAATAKPSPRPPVSPSSAPAKPEPRLAVVPDQGGVPTSVEQDVEADTEELCGHRNMSGRTCTREQGHSAKSHRYS